MLFELGQTDASQEKLHKSRLNRVNSIVGRAEKLLLAAQDCEKRGDIGTARILRKRSCQKAVLAAKMMGPLIVIAGMDLNEQAARVKHVFVIAKSSSGVKNA